MQPERPTVATHAGTVAPGWVEIETGGELDRYAPRVLAFVAPTTVKIGVAHAMQLDANFSVLHDTPDGRSGTGFGDASIGLKMRLVDDAPIVGDFAVLPSVKFPTGSTRSGFGSGTTDVALLLISSHAFGGVSMDVNAGVTRRSGDGSKAPTLASVWTVSFGLPVAGRMGWAAELFGYPGTGGPQGSPGTAAILTGPTYLMRDWLAFDTGVIAPLTGPQPRAAF
ncbi:MAG TPA: transporter, partial [Candidatus Elarobacter sp.]|nr:transporter [Candidatus Elarobacter sp.]